MDANAASYNVIGAAIEVHRALGPGFSERVCESELAIELAHRGVAFQRQHPFEVLYRGQRVGEGRSTWRRSSGTCARWGAPLGLELNFGCANLREDIQRVVA